MIGTGIAATVQPLVAGAPLLASPGDVYLLFAGILLLGGFIVTGYGLRHSGIERTVILIGAVPAVSMGIGYFLMGVERLTVETAAGAEQSIARFIAYTFVLLAIAMLIRLTIDLDRRRFWKLFGFLVFIPWTALASWMVGGALNSVLTLFSIVAYLFAAYLLFRPIDQVARGAGGQRWLFFAKLRNLFVLCWGVLVLMSASSEQVMGLTDRFTAQLGAGYGDLVLMFGTAFLVISSLAVFTGNEQASVAEDSETQTQGAATSHPESGATPPETTD